MTWYPQDYIAKVPMTNMAMRSYGSYPGRTYRFYKGPVVFPFGHGMSYSTFVHSLAQAPIKASVSLSSLRASKNTTISSKAIKMSHANCESPSIDVHVDVKNTGGMDGSQTLLVFSTPPAGEFWAQDKQLVGFEKVHVMAGSQQRVRVKIHPCKHLSVADKSGIRRIPMGQHTLHIGDLQHSISLSNQL